MSNQLSTRIVQPASPNEWDHARQLVEEYAPSLDVDLSFQNFTTELQQLASEYAPPGGFFMVEENGRYLACVPGRWGSLLRCAWWRSVS